MKPGFLQFSLKHNAIERLLIQHMKIIIMGGNQVWSEEVEGSSSSLDQEPFMNMKALNKNLGTIQFLHTYAFIHNTTHIEGSK